MGSRLHLTFVSDCAPTVIALPAYRKEDVDLRMKRCLVARRELRRSSNEGTLRAFRNADRFTTFKIFRRPGTLRRRIAPGQSGRSDRIGRPQWGWQINLVCASARGCLAR